MVPPTRCSHGLYWLLHSPGHLVSPCTHTHILLRKDHNSESNSNVWLISIQYIDICVSLGEPAAFLLRCYRGHQRFLELLMSLSSCWRFGQWVYFWECTIIVWNFSSIHLFILLSSLYSSLIFFPSEVLGVPTEESWPGVSDLPNYKPGVCKILLSSVSVL